MAILVPGVITPPPIEGVFVPDNGIRSVITWITPGGEEVPLTGNIEGVNAGVIVQPGLKGFDSPAISLILDEMPSQDGSMYRSKRAPTRELFIPLFLWAPDRTQFLALKRALINAMSPDDGIGTLRIVEPSTGSCRYIRCFLSSGLEGDDTTGNGFTYAAYGVVLHAPDPYWYGQSQDVVIQMSETHPINFFTGKDRGSVGEATGPFTVPGIHLSSTYIPPSGRIITVDGDVSAWPVWKVTGANATSFTLRNTITNQFGETVTKSLTLNHNFSPSGDTVTVDSRPGMKTVTSATTGNIYFELGPDPSFWALKAGFNNVEISLMSSSVDVTGSVLLTYQPRYRGA